MTSLVGHFLQGHQITSGYSEDIIINLVLQLTSLLFQFLWSSSFLIIQLYNNTSSFFLQKKKNLEALLSARCRVHQVLLFKHIDKKQQN